MQVISKYREVASNFPDVVFRYGDLDWLVNPADRSLNMRTSTGVKHSS